MVFFVLFFGTWTVFAIFSGGAVAMAMNGHRPAAQRSLPLAAMLIAGINCCFTLSNHSLPGYGARTVAGVVTLALLLSSVIAFWRAADSAGRIFRAFSLFSLALACVWFAANTFVTPMLWGPPGGFALAQLAFAAGVLVVASCAVFAFRAAGNRMLTPAVSAGTWLGHVTLSTVIVMTALAIFFSATVQTLWEERRHQESLDLYRVMNDFSRRVKEFNAGSAAKIFPADLNAGSARDYLARLRAQWPDVKSDLDLSRVRIANVGSADPPGTVFLRSDDDECQVNIFMDVMGGVLHYPRGSFAINRKGDLWFYPRVNHAFLSSSAPKLTNPPRTPVFLPTD